MSGFQRAAQRGRLCFIPCFSVLLLLLFSQALKHRWQENWHKRRILESTEMPAEHIDPAAIDLTPLVNALINSSHSGSRQLFSLLSVTSYSSLALHKLTLLVYNISSIKNVESNMFRRRFCYCVTNETNDLTDFTAILLDVVGNSTSSLHELFKSSSILSVSQRNNSDCIYICVMAGKMSREVPELWEFNSIPPLFNQTVIEGPHRGNVSSFRLPVEWHQLPTNLSHVSPSGTSSLLTSRVQSMADESPSVLHEAAPTATVASSARQPTPVAPQSQPAAETTALQPFPTRSRPASAVTTARAAAPLSTVPSRPATLPTVSLTRLATEAQLTPHVTSVHPTMHLTVAQRTTGAVSQRTTIPSRPEETEKPGCPWRRPELSRDGGSTSTTTVSAHKLQPCVLELCKFFSQCLCRPSTHRTRMKRYCDDSHLWYEKHTSEVCRRVRRISFSRNLKQRCLTKMCSKL